MEVNDNPAIGTEVAILRAAEAEFLEKGFAGARTVAIAEKAGVTHALLHYYFRTKEQLFERILKEKMELVSSSVIRIFGDATLPLAERIESGIRSHFDLLATMPGLPRFFINELHAADESRMVLIRQAVAERLGGLLEGLQRDIDDAAAKGTCAPVSAVMLVQDILSLNMFAFLSLPMLEVLPGSTVSREEYLSRRKEENVTLILKRLFR